jgi:hypothetical protein
MDSGGAARRAGPRRGSGQPARTLAALFEGPFPAPREPLLEAGEGAEPPGGAAATAPGEPPGVAGRLLLVGASEPFKNHRLFDPDFRADHLLLNAVAALALGDGLAAVASRRPAARGFDYVAPERRLRWRVAVLGGGQRCRRWSVSPWARCWPADRGAGRRSAGAGWRAEMPPASSRRNARPRSAWTGPARGCAWSRPLASRWSWSLVRGRRKALPPPARSAEASSSSTRRSQSSSPPGRASPRPGRR